MRVVVAFAIGLGLTVPLYAVSKEQAAFAVVKAFYEAANHSQCDKAEAFYTDGSVKNLKDSLGSGGFSLYCLDKAGKAPLTGIQLMKAEVKKDEADVLAERAYGDGSRVVESDHLVNEKGTWKLVWPSTKPAQ